MIHTKMLNADMMRKYKTWCQHDYHHRWHGCWVAYPYPIDGCVLVRLKDYNQQGMQYNCFINCKVDEYWTAAAPWLLNGNNNGPLLLANQRNNVKTKSSEICLYQVIL